MSNFRSSFEPPAYSDGRGLVSCEETEDYLAINLGNNQRLSFDAVRVTGAGHIPRIRST